MIKDLPTAQYVILGLAILLITALFIIIKLYSKRRPSKQDSDCPSGSIPIEKHREILKDALRDRDKYYTLYEGLKNKYAAQANDESSNETIQLQAENSKLKQRNEELTRKNNELNRLLESDPIPSDDLKLVDDVTSKINDKFVTRYASFPRSAGSSIYFSDLSDKLADDSYFELRISNETGIASFRPLDFMKIRNYDPAMAAIQTDGVKPNVASSVVGIEAGKARLEGNDWIINEPAKVKLI